MSEHENEDSEVSDQSEYEVEVMDCDDLQVDNGVPQIDQQISQECNGKILKETINAALGSSKRKGVITQRKPPKKPTKSKGVRKNNTFLEKQLLAELVVQVAKTVESPRTRNQDIEKKNNAWQAVHENYNILRLDYGITVERSEAQLRRLWQRVKKDCREEDTEHAERRETGNGSDQEGEKEQTDEQIINSLIRRIVPTIDFTLNNEFDSTGQVEAARNQVNIRKLPGATQNPSASSTNSDNIHESLRNNLNERPSAHHIIQPSKNSTLQEATLPKLTAKIDIKSTVKKSEYEEQDRAVKILTQQALKMTNQTRPDKNDKDSMGFMGSIQGFNGSPHQVRLSTSSHANERSPLGNISNVERNTPSPRVVPDVLGARLKKIRENEIDGTRDKRRKVSKVPEPEGEDRTCKQQEAKSHQSQIQDFKITLYNEEMKLLKNKIRASELEIEIKNVELHNKQMESRIQREKLKRVLFPDMFGDEAGKESTESDDSPTPGT